MRQRYGWVVWCLTAGLLGGLGGCLPEVPTLPPPVNVAPGLQGVYVAAGLQEPTALVVAEDGRIFFTERTTGRIRVIADGELLGAPFATVPVNYAGEQGLRGIALHPQFASNGRVYVFYTRSDDGSVTDNLQAVLDHRVVYFEPGEDPNVAAGGETFVLSLPPKGNGNRIGGQLTFAPDGRLLVAVGDLNTQDDAQSLDVLAGKILRVEPDGSRPDDNPIADSPIYAFGLRNPQGLAIDPVSEAPFVLDRQPSSFHELNRVAVRANLGWPLVIGIATTPQELEFAQNNPDYLDPVLDTGTATSPLRGLAYNPAGKYGPSTRGRLLYGIERTGQLTSVQLSEDRTAVASTRAFAAAFPTPIRALAYSPQGTLYVIAGDSILRIENFEP